MKTKIIVTVLLLLVSTNLSASFYKGTYERSGTVVATVDIVGKGIYNLVVSIQFMSKPKDKKKFETDEYVELINRLNVESKGIVLKKILTSNSIKLTDLIKLESSIEQDIDNLVKTLKTKYNVPSSTEVVYSISSFYLLEPHI